MTTEFEDFSRAVEAHSKVALSSQAVPKFNRVTVLGGGDDGQLLAALSLAQNYNVTLFSAYGRDLNELHSTGGVTLRGDGPIGTFQTDQNDAPSIQTTAELDSAVKDADLIFLTGPVHKHRTYAMVLADHLRDGQTLVIAPARTFAAFDTRWMLRVCGSRADITVVEVANLPFWTKKVINTLHLTACAETMAAAIPTQRSTHVEALKSILPNLCTAPSAIFSSFSDGSGAVECAALALGLSRVAGRGDDLPPGAQPLEEKQTFRSLLKSGPVLEVVQRLLNERREVARRFGVRNLPDDDTWIQAHAGGDDARDGRPIPSHQESSAMLRCAVVGSLIPLQSAGQLTGVPTPVTDSLIVLSSALLGWELTTAGRALEKMGITSNSADEVRQEMELIARGG